MMIAKRHKKKWTDEEVAELLDTALLDITNQVVNLEELTEKLQRTKGAIYEKVLDLRKRGAIPAKVRRPAWMKFVFKLHNLKYESKDVEKQARECFKEMTYAAEYIHQCGFVVQQIRRGVKDKNVVFICVKNLNGKEMQMKVEKQQAYILIGNVRNGWKVATTW